MSPITKSRFKHLRAFLTRGALFIIPVWLTLVVVGLLSDTSEKWLGGLTSQLVRWFVPADWLSFLGVVDGHVPGLSLLAGLISLVAIGAIASWHVGRRGLRLIDYVFLAIPGVKSIYSSARKVIEALGEPGKSRFQKVVLLDWPGPDTKTFGFVTNEILEPGTGAKQYFVFVPTVPNPTGGFVILIDADKVTMTDYTPEDALKMVISLGVIAPSSGAKL